MSPSPCETTMRALVGWVRAGMNSTRPNPLRVLILADCEVVESECAPKIGPRKKNIRTTSRKRGKLFEWPARVVGD